MDAVGRFTVREVWLFLRAAFWPAAILVGSLVLILSGSRYGFEGRNVIGSLFQIFAGAFVGAATYQSVRDNPSSFRSAVLVLIIIAGILAILVGTQTRCISGAGRGENAECFESEELEPASARNNTETALTVLIGLAGVAIGGGVLGRMNATRR
jgi:hypothetical protein